MAIAKTASRNVAFKVAKMRDAIMQDQDEFIFRKLCQAALLKKKNPLRSVWPFLYLAYF